MQEIHHVTHRHVVTVDARNHGESPHTVDMTYNVLAKDITLLLSQLNLEKVSFMGKKQDDAIVSTVLIKCVL